MPQHDQMNVMHPRVAGLDVHKMQITASVLLAQPGDHPALHTQQFSALPTGLAQLTAWLMQFGVTAAAMEATGIFWLNVYAALEQCGIRPLVFNAQQVKQIKGRKTDVADSIWLARIGQFGLGRPSFIPPAQFRDLRDVSHKRRAVVRDRSRLRARVQQILDRAGIRLGGILSNPFGVNGQRIIEGLINGTPVEQIVAGLTRHVKRHHPALRDALQAELSASARFLLADHFTAWQAANRRVAEYDRFIAAGLVDYQAQISLLTTMPGIDRTAAAAILIELGPDMQVFQNHEHCAAWAGLCPGNHESAGKRRSGRTRKGNTYLRTILIECALAAARTQDCQFQGYHQSLTVRCGFKKATVATAHKMLRIIYHLLKSGECYRDPKVNHEALMVKRNAARWVRMLIEYEQHLPAHLQVKALAEAA